MSKLRGGDMKYKMVVDGNPKAHDAYALLDLLNEHYDCDVTMTFSRARKGRANLIKQQFTVPQFALKRGETYLHYYVIHEFTHCIGYRYHDSVFKAHERQLLALFGIKIDYARAYPKALYANGEQVYKK